MTLQEKAEFSFYEKVADIDTQKHVDLVRHMDTQQFFVRKAIHDYNIDVYQRLRRIHRSYFPIIEFLAEEDGVLYLVEEYVNGRNLEQMVDQDGIFQIDEAKQMMLIICDAVSVLHRQNPPIIHRDIKAANIIKCTNGSIKLIDFNTARMYGHNHTQDTVVLGTRGYASPEQYGYRQTDERSDIYSLGVLFNYLLTGEYPSVKLYQGVAMQVIQRCTEFDPAKRYATVDALIRDIERIPERYSEHRCEYADKPNQISNAALDNVPKSSVSAVSTAEKTGKRKGLWNFRFLPPGFRTGRIWKMSLASIVYLLMTWIGATMNALDANGELLSDTYQVRNRIGFLVLIYLEILFLCNYGGIHGLLPLTKSENTGLRILGYILFGGLILVTCVFVTAAMTMP